MGRDVDRRDVLTGRAEVDGLDLATTRVRRAAEEPSAQGAGECCHGESFLGLVCPGTVTSRSHRLATVGWTVSPRDAHQVGPDGVEAGLLAQPGAEVGHGPGGAVAVPVEAAVHGVGSGRQGGRTARTGGLADSGEGKS